VGESAGGWEGVGGADCEGVVGGGGIGRMRIRLTTLSPNSVMDREDFVVTRVDKYQFPQAFMDRVAIGLLCSMRLEIVRVGPGLFGEPDEWVGFKPTGAEGAD